MTGPRRRIRLSGFDYASPGGYFVTVCARRRRCVFGSIRDDEMHANELGRLVQRCWTEIPMHFPGVERDAFVLMPNHIHGILQYVGVGYIPPLPVVIATFKAAVSRTIGDPVWQRSYHERIIRDERELAAKRQYIADNPIKWAVDRENPANRRRFRS